MASTGLSSLISNTGVQTTCLPSWMNTAQQNVVNQATAANAAAPTPQNTVAQNAVNSLSGPTNAFSTATGTLQNIASGAANPWIQCAANGTVTPNTSTALGGLFQAQNQQLQQLAPSIMAPSVACSAATGNFGSLRGQTAADTALTNAAAQLTSAQDTAALQNQATGVQAGAQAGNVAQQGINNELTVGQYQQSSPYTNAANLGNVLAGIQTGNTVSNTTNLSPLNQIMGIASALGGSGVSTSGLFGKCGPLAGVGTALSKLFSSCCANADAQNSQTTDNSKVYSGCTSIATPGGITSGDIQNAANAMGYTTQIGGCTGS